ncbi:unnamed protein product, partial [Polarella glacialis]
LGEPQEPSPPRGHRCHHEDGRAERAGSHWTRTCRGDRTCGGGGRTCTSEPKEAFKGTSKEIQQRPALRLMPLSCKKATVLGT